MTEKKLQKPLLYAVYALFVFFGVWLVFGIIGYGRRVAHDREALRQSAAIRENFDRCAVLHARYITGNNAIIAHITVPGTALDYAVVHCNDNFFYLTHDLFGQPNENGAIFLDYANSPSFTDPNTIIYGHNRQSGMKFHDLELFQEQDFFEKNSTIRLATLEGKLIYEIFAVFTAHISFQYIQVDFASDDDFLSLMTEIKDRAMHTRDVTIEADDRILILSTCTNIGPTGRLAVVGRLKTP
ncbi:MAG: class B sortase [Defluviitaleaceae bacterium]|nr:class B sortase [Defluviitaleaceae bacterium]